MLIIFVGRIGGQFLIKPFARFFLVSSCCVHFGQFLDTILSSRIMGISLCLTDFLFGMLEVCHMP